MLSLKYGIDSWLVIIPVFVLMLIFDTFGLGFVYHTFAYVIVSGIYLDSILKPELPKLKKLSCLFFYFTLLALKLLFLASPSFDSTFRLTRVTLLLCVLLFQYLIFITIDRHNSCHKDYFTYKNLKNILDIASAKFCTTKRVCSALTFSAFYEMFSDLPRHSCIKYVNQNSLSTQYLSDLKNSISDPYIYIVLSDTGSVASNIISEITCQPFNHSSIAFDSELKTLVSFNGGEKIFPPGLNQELLPYFFKKPDARVNVYRLKISKSQKNDMISKIIEINNEGSSYNLLGICKKTALKPNIMFCSQFVYSLLEMAGANYFTNNPLTTRPTDLVELDIHNKLEYLDTLYKETVT